MKLRIKGNSVRLRLTRSEVNAVGNGKAVSQITTFSPTTRLEFSLEVSESVGEPHASFENCHLAITLPMNVARDWACSDQVSISASQTSREGETLTILVEKDFECLHHPRDTDDTFPNPRSK